MNVVERDGLQWYSGTGLHDDHLGYDPHEANLEPCLRGLLGHDRVFLDIGAHVGHWTLRMAWQARKVIAVEANPETATTLHANIALNHLANIMVYEVAAWDCHATLRLEDPNGRERGGSTRVLPSEGTEARLVTALPLDEMLEVEPEIHLVKLDVEGADLHALRGMRQTLARCQPIMFIERHDQYGYYTWQELQDLLAELGYNHRAAPGYLNAEYIIATPAQGVVAR